MKLQQTPGPRELEGRWRQGGNGCTRIEPLVVIAIIAILAGLLLPALGKFKSRVQGAAGLSNLKPLTLGWIQYGDEYQDWILGTGGWRPPGARGDLPTWSMGWRPSDDWLDIENPRKPGNWDGDLLRKRSALMP